MLKKNADAFLPVSSNWFHILLCLVEGEQHGYGIMQNVLARSDGNLRLWPATLYGSFRAAVVTGSNSSAKTSFHSCGSSRAQ
jgi:hypothetical protein